MAYTIAFSGKGGVGKTTLCGLLIRYMLETGKYPILVVDADSNYNLNEVLGLEVETTLGDIREQMKRGEVPIGMTKDRFIDTKLEESIIETDKFDLLVMGRPEGQGCYCAANTLLANFLSRLVGNYDYIVMDNEAGMEHISRLTTKDVDALVVVSDISKRGLQAAKRINELASSLHVVIGRGYLVLNNVEGELSDGVKKYIDDIGLEFLGCVMKDPKIQEYDMLGKPTFEIPEDSVALKSAYEVFKKIV